MPIYKCWLSTENKDMAGEIEAPGHNIAANNFAASKFNKKWLKEGPPDIIVQGDGGEQKYFIMNIVQRPMLCIEGYEQIPLPFKINNLGEKS